MLPKMIWVICRKEKEDFIWNIAHVRKLILNPLIRIQCLEFFDNMKVRTIDLNQNTPRSKSGVLLLHNSYMCMFF